MALTSQTSGGRSGTKAMELLLWFRPALGPTQPPIQWVSEALSLGVKQKRREADHLPPTRIEIKKTSIYTSTLPIHLHGVVLWLVMHRLNFTFDFYNNNNNNRKQMGIYSIHCVTFCLIQSQCFVILYGSELLTAILSSRARNKAFPPKKRKIHRWASFKKMPAGHTRPIARRLSVPSVNQTVMFESGQRLQKLH
jgi:hypothetical protein